MRGQMSVAGWVWQQTLPVTPGEGIKGQKHEGAWVTQCSEQRAMGDSLSDRLLQDLIHGYQDLAEDIGCLPILRWHAEDVDRAPTNESALDISKTFQPQILQKKNFNWNAFRKQTKSFSQPFDFCIIFILTFENSVSKFHSSTSIPWEFKGLKALNV